MSRSSVLQNIRRLMLSVVLALGFPVLVNAQSTGSLCSAYPADAPVQLLSEDLVTTAEWFNVVPWPSAETIEKLRLSAVDNSPIKEGAAFVLSRIVVRRECLPADMASRYIALKGCLFGNDVLIARYKCADYLIHLYQTAGNLRIVARGESAAARGGAAEREAFASKFINTYFLETDRISTASARIRNVPRYMEVLPAYDKLVVVATLEQKTRPIDTLYWRTDGQTIYCQVIIQPGASTHGMDGGRWFAYELSLVMGLRKRRLDPVTEDMIKRIYGE